MAVAVSNNIGGYDDVNYIAVNGKSIRQIILGNGKPKKQLTLEDCKYMYIGADRATEIWKPFHFETERLLMNNKMYVNVISPFESVYATPIKSRDVYGYSYRYKGFDRLPDTSLTDMLFGLVTNTSPYTDFIMVEGNRNTVKLTISDSTTATKETIWENETSLLGATFSINLYATNSYLYKNTGVKPKLFADIILDYSDNSQQHKHVVHTSKNVLGEFGGQCPFLSKFFSERRDLTDCTIYSTLSDLKTDYQTSIVNYFVKA